MGIDIEAMRKVCEAATKGPIRVRELRRPGFCAVVETEKPWDIVGTMTVASYERDEDAEFHIAARTALPSALDEIEALRKVASAATALVGAMRGVSVWGVSPYVDDLRAALRAHEKKVKP